MLVGSSAVCHNNDMSNKVEKKLEKALLEKVFFLLFVTGSRGATTLSILTLSITTFSMMTFSIMTRSIMTKSIMTQSTMT